MAHSEYQDPRTALSARTVIQGPITQYSAPYPANPALYCCPHYANSTSDFTRARLLINCASCPACYLVLSSASGQSWSTPCSPLVSFFAIASTLPVLHPEHPGPAHLSAPLSLDWYPKTYRYSVPYFDIIMLFAAALIDSSFTHSFSSK